MEYFENEDFRDDEDIWIYVNRSPIQLPKDTFSISYEQLILLISGDLGKLLESKVEHGISYANGFLNKKGRLRPGESIGIKPEMTFTIMEFVTSEEHRG